MSVLESLKFFAESSQCKHILLACCHDAGYAPYLGRFVADGSAERITLLVGSPATRSIKELGFKNITQFDSVFVFSGSQDGTYVSVPGNMKGVPKYFYSVPPRQSAKLSSADNSARRAGLPPGVSREEVERVRGLKLCSWLFLRGECGGCPRNHHHRPLSDAEFEALWYIARQRPCTKREGCADPMCIWGHGSTRS